MGQVSFMVSRFKRFLEALIVLQLIIIVGIYLDIRTDFIWFWAIFSFILALLFGLIIVKRELVFF